MYQILGNHLTSVCVSITVEIVSQSRCTNTVNMESRLSIDVIQTSVTNNSVQFGSVQWQKGICY